MPKALKIILTIIIVLALAMLAIKGLSNEDDWICVDKEWVKHGNPNAPMPIIECK
ncbi:MAG: hypothetical protein ABIG10_01580 [bacterium]